MSNCPKCETPVPDSAFGLYTCQECKSVLSVDFNGDVSLDGIAPASSTSSNVIPDIALTRISDVDQVKDEPLWAAPAEEEPFELPERNVASGGASFEDVVSFGNSTTSSGQDGAFLYDVLVRGIDSEDLREAVKEALVDNRFGWKGEDVVSKMRGGSILLHRLNSVKASILINRLKSYPLEISWVQNGIYEVEAKS